MVKTVLRHMMENWWEKVLKKLIRKRDKMRSMDD
jgi:hypothetical protein